MEIKLIKTYDIPASVRKQLAKYTALELYTDRLVGKGNRNGDVVYFFKNYIDVNWSPATVFTQYAQVVFITPENSNNYYLGSNLESFNDVNKIPFCSGMFSYATANDYARSLCEDIRKAMNEYQEMASKADATTPIIQQTSAADELKKFKELADMGIISQEEFEAKKKQLLGKKFKERD